MSDQLNEEQFNRMFGIEPKPASDDLAVATLRLFAFHTTGQLREKYGDDAVAMAMMMLGVAVAAGADLDRPVSHNEARAGLEKMVGPLPS